jgi:hypothetical protein
MHEAEASAPQELPRVLIYITALACGVFLALAVHIGLSAGGAGRGGALRGVFGGGPEPNKTALAWWAIGLAGCFGSLGTILLLRKTAADRRALRLLRLSLGLAFFCLLAAAGSKASSAPAHGAAMTTAANLAAMGLGAFMAFFAAHFAARR